MLALQFAILLLPAIAHCRDYQVPHPKFKLLAPKGFSVSIPEEDGIQLFAFHGSVNKAIPNQGLGVINGDVVRKTHGKWVYQNKTVKIQEGDVVNYWVFVLKNGKGYIGDVQRHEFKAADFKKLSAKNPYQHMIKKRYAHRHFFPDSLPQDYEDEDNDYAYPHPYHRYPHKHMHRDNYDFQKPWAFHPHKHGKFHGNSFYHHHHHNHPGCNPGFYHKDISSEETTMVNDMVTNVQREKTTTARRITTTPATTTTTTTTTTSVPETTFPLIDVRFGGN